MTQREVEQQNGKLKVSLNVQTVISVGSLIVVLVAHFTTMSVHIDDHDKHQTRAVKRDDVEQWFGNDFDEHIRETLPRIGAIEAATVAQDRRIEKNEDTAREILKKLSAIETLIRERGK